jgi:hypothetical protein
MRFSILYNKVKHELETLTYAATSVADPNPLLFYSPGSGIKFFLIQDPEQGSVTFLTLKTSS